MGTNLGNTAAGSAKGSNATRGLILVLVVIGILGSIYAVARQRPPKMRPDEMVLMPTDTREHGVSLEDEAAGATGLQAPEGSGGMGSMAVPGDAGGAAGSAGTAGPGGAASGGHADGKHYGSLPGIEIASFPEETRHRILERANHTPCTCDCDMTLAQCRNEDPSCNHSLAEIAILVGEEARKDIKSGLIKD